jgi:predicted nucleic acid-binding protein
MNSILIDTNILVYAIDPEDVAKQEMAIYDAQIWAAARLHQIPVLFSEDFNPGVYGGVRVVNPFAPAFVLEDWL